MNIGVISFHEDSYNDLDFFFIDEVRIKETEKRFSSYLKEYFNFNDDNQSVTEETRDNSDNGDNI
jgi:hypothetical protein